MLPLINVDVCVYSNVYRAYRRCGVGVVCRSGQMRNYA